MKQAAVAFLALMALQASAASLEEEMQRLVADATAALRTHEAKLEALSLDSAATEGDYRAAFGEYAAQRDAQFAHALDIYQRRKAQVTAQEWEKLPRLPLSDDGTIQELLGFMQTYDATPGDLKPVLQQLRAENAAREEQAIRSRFRPLSQ